MNGTESMTNNLIRLPYYSNDSFSARDCWTQEEIKPWNKLKKKNSKYIFHNEKNNTADNNKIVVGDVAQW